MDSVKVVILGAGGPGRDVLEIIRDINNQNAQEIYDCIGFLDNDSNKTGDSVCGIEVLGTVSDASDLANDVKFVNTIGGASYFWKIPEIIGEAEINNDRFETIVHPDAYVSDSAELGQGVVVYPQSAIYSGANIGNQVMIKGARIGHNQPIGNYSRIEGGVCLDSKAEVGKCCYLGLNSTIRESIGDFAQVGMGSVVIEEVAKGEVVAGNPAEYIRDTVDTEDKYVDL